MKGKIRRCAVWDAYLTDAEVVAAVTELTAEAPAQTCSCKEFFASNGFNV